MSGYLSHLVSRALGLESPISPARGNPFESNSLSESQLEDETSLPSLLPPAVDPTSTSRVPSTDTDPVARLDAVVALSPPAVRTDAAVASGRSPRIEAQASERGGFRSAPQQSIQQTSHDEENSRDAEPPVTSTRARAASIDQPRPESGRSPEGAREAASHSETSRPRETRAEARIASAATARNTNTAAQARSATRRAQAGVQAAAQEREHAPVTDSPSKPITRSESSVAPEKAPRSIQTLMPAPRPSSPPVRQASGLPHERAPDVHITIGRVEIRAQQNVPSPKPATNPPRATRPTLSLDEYLKRRGGERS